MVTRIYVEALLVDEELADQVLQLWMDGVIDDQLAATSWWLIVVPDRITKPYDNK